LLVAWLLASCDFIAYDDCRSAGPPPGVSRECIERFRAAVEDSVLAREEFGIKRGLGKPCDSCVMTVSRRVFFNERADGLILFDYFTDLRAASDSMTIISVHKAWLRDSVSSKVYRCGVYMPVILTVSDFRMQKEINKIDSLLPSLLADGFVVHLTGCVVPDETFNHLREYGYSEFP